MDLGDKCDNLFEPDVLVLCEMTQVQKMKLKTKWAEYIQQQ